MRECGVGGVRVGEVGSERVWSEWGVKVWSVRVGGWKELGVLGLGKCEEGG